MKGQIYFMAGFMFLITTSSMVFGSNADDYSTNPNYSGSTLFQTGRALLVGETLTNSLKMIPPATFPDRKIPEIPSLKPYDLGKALIQPPQIPDWKPYRVEDFGIDLSKINPQALDNKVVGDLAMTIMKNEFRIAGGPYGLGVTAFTVLDTGMKLRDAWRVGTGRAEPDVLRGTIPHVVMAWEALRGPENNKWQSVTSTFNRTFDDGAWKIHQWGTRTVEKSVISNAPGAIGRYGYAPSTDSTVYKNNQSIHQKVEFDGNRFNQNYLRNNTLSSPPSLKMPSYSPPPRLTTPSFSSPPSFKMPSFSTPLRGGKW